MAGHTSQSGQVIIAEQAVEGTPVSDANLLANGIGLRLRSGSLAGNRDMLTTDPEIGGGRDTTDAYGGGIVFSGDYDLYTRFNTAPLLLRGAFGVSESATATGLSTHTITPSDGQLPFFTVYEEIGTNLVRFKYTDVVVNTLHLEAEANGFLTMTAGLIARMGVSNTPDVEAETILDNTALVVGTNIHVTYDGVTLPAKSFSFDLTNNFEDDNFYLGSLYVGDLTAKSREVTASVNLRHEDAGIMKQALFGSSTLTQAGGLISKKELVITCEAYEDIPGATPATKYLLELTLGKVALEPFAFEPSGDDAIEGDVAMRAVRPDSSVPIVEAVIKNGREDITVPA
ncbi:major tail protein [Rhodococcus phage Mbo2]|uniref:Major tail protein n=1 Tax=Rhodococcus phage Mbo2 TaxID=2936911 RepID=A0A9E7IED1_9CAUD|nr:major tail protein [Rhodococcus phage Mbo2]